MKIRRTVCLVFLTAVLGAARADQVAPPGQPKPDPHRCELVEIHGHRLLREGTLSPFWAQEYIGASHARAALTRQGSLTPPNIGILDVGVQPRLLLGPVTDEFRRTFGAEIFSRMGDSHGTKVANLINGPPPVGVGVGRIAAFLPVFVDTDTPAHLQQMARENVRLVNASIRWEPRAAFSGLQELSEKTIVVFASGNSGSYTAFRPPTAPNVIGVGSLTPEGFVASFSQGGPGVDIMAPSDNDSLTSSADGYVSFGGTSGAAPQVTGALSNAVAVLPDLSPAEARILLERTAVPTVDARQDARRNGAGMVNALKLAEAAIRLKQRGWPRNRGQLLRDPAIYDFSVTRPGEAALNIESLLSQGRRGLTSKSCLGKREGFHQVERAFLLAAGSPSPVSKRVFEEARQILIDRLKAMGLTGNAAFYQSLVPEGLARSLEDAIPRGGLDEMRNVSRSLGYLPLSVAEGILSRAVVSARLTTVLNAVEVLRVFRSVSVATIAYRHSDAQVRREVVRSTLFGSEAASILREALLDPDAETRVLAAARLAGVRK